MAILTDKHVGRRRAAAYLAKYSTKSTEDHGVLDHRRSVREYPNLSSCLFTSVNSSRLPGTLEESRRTETSYLGPGPIPRDTEVTSSRSPDGSRRRSPQLRATQQEWRIEKKRKHGAVAEHAIEDDTDNIVCEWKFLGIG